MSRVISLGSYLDRCSVSGPSHYHPWWRVDLGDSYWVTSVSITNEIQHGKDE